jgi:hypothetical protein
VFERAALRCVALKRPRLDLVVACDRHDRRGRPDAGPEQRRDSPGEHAGHVLVPVVLEAEPRPVGPLLAHDAGGVVGQHVVGIGQAEGREDCGRCEGVDRVGERDRDRCGCWPLRAGEVLVVGELEPYRVGLEHRKRGAVLLAPPGHDVITGGVAAVGVPLGRRVRVPGRPPAEHRDDGGTGVRGEEAATSEHRVIEVR